MITVTLKPMDKADTYEVVDSIGNRMLKITPNTGEQEFGAWLWIKPVSATGGSAMGIRAAVFAGLLNCGYRYREAERASSHAYRAYLRSLLDE